MNSRDWFEGVLGWSVFGDPQDSPMGWWLDGNQKKQGIKFNIGYKGNLATAMLPEIADVQEAWIEHVVEPMRGMGYWWEKVGDGQTQEFEWWKTSPGEEPSMRFYAAPIKDDQIFQASLEAAEKCPEVKEKLEKWRSQ